MGKILGGEPHEQRRNGSSEKKIFKVRGLGSQVQTFWVRGGVRTILVREPSKRVRTTPEEPFGSPISEKILSIMPLGRKKRILTILNTEIEWYF